METPALTWITSSPAPTMASISPAMSLPFISPQKRTFSPIPRPSLPPLALASKKNENEADLHSDSDDINFLPVTSNRRLPLLPLCKDAAMGLVLSAAVGRGWTTGSGMEGPSVPAAGGMESANISTFPWSLFTKSPRRRMLVAFTCNICGQRTTRAINPHAYTDGTVFVQCCGCTAFHKLVDNLNLFQNMNCYLNPNFSYKDSGWDVKFKYLDTEDGEDDIFPSDNMPY